MSKYGLIWRGRLVRLSSSLDAILLSETLRPGCVIVRFEYDETHQPVHVEEVKLHEMVEV